MKYIVKGHERETGITAALVYLYSKGKADVLRCSTDRLLKFFVGDDMHIISEDSYNKFKEALKWQK